MRLRMLKLSVGKGRQVMKQLCLRALQYDATVATERAGYVLYRALVEYVFGGTTLDRLNRIDVLEVEWSPDLRPIL